ncbi:MAG: S41 family peptidase [Flavobacteriales bacterium]|nr:S41 family peptidase [Flavobacteriales bacterium]MCB9204310.1 S41 family peptidase [Flavobacteriales bacterium]
MKNLMLVGFMLLYSAAFGQRTIKEEYKLKFDDVLNLIEEKYVEHPDYTALVDEAIIGMVKELDPHSEYMTAEEYQKMSEPLTGNFEGIGIQFNITKDTITVVSPISGGPSERLGIRSGDKIVVIEDTVVAGIGITNRDVIDKLRGDKGTKVRIKILRRKVKDLIDYTIERDKIPIFSLDASYMLTEDIGYVKLNRFAQTTMQEFYEALDELEPQGMEHLVLDLRGNSGGYLNTAIQLSDEFLADKELIVYTEGVSNPKRESFATRRGRFEKGKLVVLIDEGSASASEIVAGAIQDHDRGLIIGRRSFGKGLVQRPFKLRDGSTLKLTTARYYTPAGRCIQRPYEDGNDEYRKENQRRRDNGEFFSMDSVHFNEEDKYLTDNKRIVYGGGGILPDIFIPLDTSESSDFLTELLSNGLFYQYINEYVDENREELNSKYPDYESFEKGFDPNDEFMDKFLEYAKHELKHNKDDKLNKDDVEVSVNGEEVEIENMEGIKKEANKDMDKMIEEGLATSGHIIKTRLRALLARTLWQTEAFYRVFNAEDHAVKKAIESIDDKTFRKLKLSYN